MGLNKSVFSISFRKSFQNLCSRSNTKTINVSVRKKGVWQTFTWSNEAWCTLNVIVFESRVLCHICLRFFPSLFWTHKIVFVLHVLANFTFSASSHRLTHIISSSGVWGGRHIYIWHVYILVSEAYHSTYHKTLLVMPYHIET